MGGIKNDTIPKTYVGDGSTINVSGNVISSYDPNQLGEVKLFALSMSGAVTKATLQGKGWAICDGTTPASQGISTPTITTTPNLEHKFLRMSDNESSGATGGSETHTHDVPLNSLVSTGATNAWYASNTTDTNTGGASTLPTYYGVVWIMRVR